MSVESDLREDKRKEAKSLFYRMLRDDGLTEYSADRIAKRASHFFQEQYAEAVAQSPKQEHLSSTEMTEIAKNFAQSCHNHNICDFCKRMTDAAFEAGKASLKPWDAMRIAEYATSYYDAESEDAYQLAKELEQKFAAPERKSCTEEQAWDIYTKVFPENDSGLPKIAKNMLALMHAINDVLGLQPAPVEAER